MIVNPSLAICLMAVSWIVVFVVVVVLSGSRFGWSMVVDVGLVVVLFQFFASGHCSSGLCIVFRSGSLGFVAFSL